MKTNENKKNHLVIYTILLNLEDENFWTRNFGIGKTRKEGISHMKKIAELGGTEDVHLLETPEAIHKTLIKIANAITPKYGLLIK